MEVRCPSCNKLFRVSDDKIQGSGVKFGCTRCSSSVKITREDFDRYQASDNAALAETPVFFSTGSELKAAPVADHAAQPARTGKSDAFDMSDPATAAAALEAFDVGEPASSNSVDAFDLSEPAAAAADLQEREEEMPVFLETVPAKPLQAPVVSAPEVKVAQQPAARVQPKPAPAPPVKTETVAPEKPKQEQAPPASPAAPAPAPVLEHRANPSPPDAAPRPQAPLSSGIGKKAAILIIAVIIIGSAAAGARYYLGGSSQKVSDSVPQLMTPEGLLVKDASGAVDPVKQDLIVSGMVENTTDKPKAAWYILVEVYDAQGTVLTKAKLLNGKQLYTRRDFEILARRGENIQDVKMKQLQEQGVTIPALGSANFEIRVMEPPVGIASFNATLQTFDPVQLFKELSEEQK